MYNDQCEIIPKERDVIPKQGMKWLQDATLASKGPQSV